MINVGIVGTGLIAREHAQALDALPDSFKLIAASDVSPVSLQSFSSSFNIARCYCSLHQLLDDQEIDLVVIATPPCAHEEGVIAALDRGKYVLCEKPISHCLAAAQRITAADERNAGKLTASYQLRYLPQYRRMLWLIKHGWIGKLESAVVERHGLIPHIVTGKGAWWGAWDVAGGGVFMTQMIHELDIMLKAMGEPLSVKAEMDTRFTSIESEDWIEAHVTFAGGCSARCAASVNSGQIRGGFTIKGSHGEISPGRLSLKDPALQARALAAVDAALPDTRQMSLPKRALLQLGRRLGLPDKPELSAHALLYRDIARAIDSGEPLPIPSSEALKSLQLCSAAYEAATSGKQVTLPMKKDAATFAGVTPVAYATRPKPAKTSKMVAAPLPKSSTVRVGLIGLDTTHATTFTELLHNPYASDHIPGARVVAAYAGGSPDMSVSISRVEGFTDELRGTWGVPIYDSPEEVADACDVIFILSCDGRTHPGLFRSVAGRGRPVFIDKPMAISSADAERIREIAKASGTPIFASSAFRYADGLVAAVNSIRATGEQITTCRVRYWGQIQPTQGRFFWYGIHGAEMLMAVMGEGVKSVESYTSNDEDLIEVTHKDGRRSTMIGSHTDGSFSVSIETDKRTLDIPIGGNISARILAAALDVLAPGGYPRLWRVSDSGSVSGRPGKSLDPGMAETMEVIALLDAAQRSHTSRQTINL
jgi:predicted dehydrogenase